MLDRIVAVSIQTNINMTREWNYIANAKLRKKIKTKQKS